MALPERVHQWVDLFEAVGGREWAAAQPIALAMLQTPPEDQDALDFLEQELLIADLKQGGSAAARRRFAQLGTINADNLSLRYLRALSTQ